MADINGLTVKAFSAWAPELGSLKENPSGWAEWADEKTSFVLDSSSPKLEYVDPLLKRRLSQLTKMTIQVIKDVKDEAPLSKIVFTSFRGEVARQLKLNTSLAEDYEVLPASFSLSVFNTPPAAATIALKMKEGYTAIYPSENNFYSGVLSGCASLLSGEEEQIIFVYADELIPSQYSAFASVSYPFAFSMVLSAEKDGITLSEDFIKGTPENLLRYLIKRGL